MDQQVWRKRPIQLQNNDCIGTANAKCGHTNEKRRGMPNIMLERRTYERCDIGDAERGQHIVSA